MAGGVTPRPRRGALKEIPLDLPSTRSEEFRKVLALHDQATENRTQQPVSTNNLPAQVTQSVSGGRTTSKMKIRGGTFAPLAKDNFL